jgi:nucleoside recognition membrane protein YjiH
MEDNILTVLKYIIVCIFLYLIVIRLGEKISVPSDPVAQRISAIGRNTSLESERFYKLVEMILKDKQQ